MCSVFFNKKRQLFSVLLISFLTLKCSSAVQLLLATKNFPVVMSEELSISFSSKLFVPSDGERASLRLCVSVAGGVSRVPAAETRLASRTNRASQNTHRETGRSRRKNHIAARQAGVRRRVLRKEDRLSFHHSRPFYFFFVPIGY